MTRTSDLPVILAAAAVGLAACGERTGGGGGQKTAGHVESAVGSMTGDEHLKHEGKKDEVVGGVKSTAHDLKDAVHDATR